MSFSHIFPDIDIDALPDFPAIRLRAERTVVQLINMMGSLVFVSEVLQMALVKTKNTIKFCIIINFQLINKI